ncbi:tetratricopeptide repeat protein [Shivajiella indica]|uniref:histidine kinase n=1 Tax=Shivajiella indica TaxID=872115 RepID=A0ABW5B5V9_9BACT
MKKASIILFYYLILILTSNRGFGQQNQKMDSLSALIENTTVDSVRVEAMMALAWEKMYKDPEEAKNLGLKGISFLKSIENLRIEGYAYTVMGVVYWVSSSYDSAIYYLNKSGEAYLKKNDSRGLAAVYNNISLVYQNQSTYPKALDFATKSLELAEESENKSMIANATFTVGNIHYLMEDNEKALFYYQKSLNLKNEIKDTQNIQKIHLNIGSSFHNLNLLDSAEKYYQKSLIFSKEIGDTKAEALATTNLGNLAIEKGDYSVAIDFYQKAAEMYESKLINDYDYSLLLHSLAKAHLKLEILPKAEFFARNSLNLSKKINDHKRISAAYEILSEILENKGDFKAALTSFKEATAYNDSIFNLERTAQIVEIETKYETDKKEQQIILQNYELSEQKAINQKNLILIIGLVLIIILLVVIFFLIQNHTKKQKNLLIKEKEIEIKEAYIHAALESQENERKRFAQDLHDGFGQLISALRLNISNLQRQYSDLETKTKVVDQSEAILNEMHTEIRNIAFNLMPATLIQYGLKEAVREFVQKLNLSGKIKIELDDIEMSGNLSELQEISLYRVIQEWVNNILKHSGASKITIQLVRHEDELNCIIEDDGNGFDKQLLEKSKGNGWGNIQSRLKRIKAEFELDVQNGKRGTTFIVYLPLDVEKAIEKSILEK